MLLWKRELFHSFHRRDWCEVTFNAGVEPWAWAGDVPTCCSWGWWQEVAAWLAHSKALTRQLKSQRWEAPTAWNRSLEEKKIIWAFPLKSGPKLYFFWTTCRAVGGGMSKKSQRWPRRCTFYCSPHQQRQKDWASSKGDHRDVPFCHPKFDSKECLCHTVESFLAVAPSIAVTRCKSAGVS